MNNNNVPSVGAVAVLEFQTVLTVLLSFISIRFHVECIALYVTIQGCKSTGCWG